MGQAERGIPEVASVEPAESIGRYLARQRSLRGIEIEELSRATRIPVRSLQRLESGAFDADPDGFVRGFVRTVAEALGLPADETIARMLPEVSGGAEDERPSRRLGVAGLRAALALGALAALGVALWIASLHGGLRAAHFPSRNALVVRRDAVRALAAERGILDTPAPSAAPGSSEASPQAAGGGAQRASGERSQQTGAEGAARSEAKPSEVNRRAAAQQPAAPVASGATRASGASPQAAEGGAQRAAGERSSSGRAAAQQEPQRAAGERSSSGRAAAQQGSGAQQPRDSSATTP